MRAEEIGLHKNPFSDLPDPRFTYRHNSFQAVCADLLYARLSERPGLTLITGAEGAGKTTLLEVLMSERTSADRYHSISGHRRLTFEAVLQQTAKAFGLSDDETDVATAFGDNMKAVAAFLLQPNREGGKVILMIDRAETLSEPVLRKLAELSRLAKGEGKLLQIVLAVTLTRGQLPAVFRTVRDAIAFETQLEPIGPEEVALYIQHRLGVAGLEGSLPFTDEAIDGVWRYSWGLPARVNRLCRTALQVCQVAGADRVEAPMVEEAAETCRYEEAPESAEDDEDLDSPLDFELSDEDAARLGIPRPSPEDWDLSIPDGAPEIHGRSDEWPGDLEDDDHGAGDDEAGSDAVADWLDRPAGEADKPALRLVGNEPPEELQPDQTATAKQRFLRRRLAAGPFWLTRAAVAVLVIGIGVVFVLLGGKDDASNQAESDGLPSDIARSVPMVNDVGGEVSDAGGAEQGAGAVATEPFEQAVGRPSAPDIVWQNPETRDDGSDAGSGRSDVDPEPAASAQAATTGSAGSGAAPDEAAAIEAEIRALSLRLAEIRAEQSKRTIGAEAGATPAAPAAQPPGAESAPEAPLETAAGPAPVDEFEQRMTRMEEAVAALSRRLSADAGQGQSGTNSGNQDRPAAGEDADGAAPSTELETNVARLKENPLPFALTRRPANLVRAIQDALTEVGFDVGLADGQAGGRTRQAIAEYQDSQGLKVTGRPSRSLLVHLDVYRSLRLAIARYHDGRLDEAADIYSAIVAAQPHDTSARLYRGLVRMKLGDVDQAVDDLTVVPAGSVDPTIAYFKPAQVYYIQERLKALNFDPGRYDGLFTKGTRRAIELYQRAHVMPITGEPSGALLQDLEIESHHARAIETYQMDDFPRAIELYDLVLKLKPDSAEAYFNRGLAYKKLGRVQDTLEDYEMALRYDDALSKVYYDRGRIRWSQGEYWAAVEDYWQALTAGLL